MVIVKLFFYEILLLTLNIIHTWFWRRFLHLKILTKAKGKICFSSNLDLHFHFGYLVSSDFPIFPIKPKNIFFCWYVNVVLSQLDQYRQSLDQWRVSVAGAYWAANQSARNQLREKTSGFNEAEIRLEIKWTFQGLNVINIHKSYLQKLAAEQTFHEKISFSADHVTVCRLLAPLINNIQPSQYSYWVERCIRCECISVYD